MISVADILEKELNKISEDVAKSIKDNDRSATGKTIRSLKVEVKESGNETTGTLSGRGFITTLETGRGASKSNGSGGWKEDLLEWMRARSIPAEAFYPIWKTIQERGWNTSLPNRTNPNGGTKGIISEPIEKGLQSIEQQIANRVAAVYIKSIEI